ncbi:MAG TPA: hypothetical protein VFS43_47495 [Polyangiaceae bacterium]|nr:hypothetical protein [Polyangiaceae bacterium]
MRRFAAPSPPRAALGALLGALAACSGGRADERQGAGAPETLDSGPPAAPSSPASARAAPPIMSPTPTLIGDAKMLDDGTIVLDLRHPAWVRVTYAPTHPEYASVLRHVGGLRPGESKGVPPWPDDIDDAKIEASLRAFLPTKGLSIEGCRAEVMGSKADEIVVSARCGGRPLSIRLRKGSYEVVGFTEFGPTKLAACPISAAGSPRGCARRRHRALGRSERPERWPQRQRREPLDPRRRLDAEHGLQVLDGGGDRPAVTV